MRTLIKPLMIAGVCLLPGAALAQTSQPSHVRLVLEWAFEGPQSIWTAAEALGCFKDNNLSVRIDRGFGSGDSLSKVASGAYDVGVTDFATLVGYNSRSPKENLRAVMIVNDLSSNALITLKKSGIKNLPELSGKQIADTVGASSRVLFSAFATANKIDADSIKWVNVAPNLRQTTLFQGRADAVTGHARTVVKGLQALGVKDNEMNVYRYSEYGVRTFGNAIIVNPAWAKANATAMKGILKCAAVGIKYAVANPAKSVATLKKYNSLVDEKNEQESLEFVSETSTVSDDVRKNGLSMFSDERLRSVLDQVAKAMGTAPLKADQIWDNSYLPPASDLMLKK